MRVLHLVLLVLSADLQATSFKHHHQHVAEQAIACGIFQWCHSTLTHARSDVSLLLLRLC
jgi:sulfite reductase beta subunit-like hemoprotein